MSPRRKLSGILFCLFYNDYRELEWVMPLLHHYRQRRVSITVLMPAHPRTTRQKLMSEWIADYCDKLLYPCDMVYGDRSPVSTLCSWAEQPISLTSRFIKALLYPGNRVALRTGLANLQRRNAMRTIRDIFESIDIVYVPEGTTSAKLRTNSIAELVVAAACAVEKPIVGYVISVYSKLRQVACNNQGLDLLMVASEQDRVDCLKTGLHALQCGAQRFQINWMDELIHYFGEIVSAQALAELAAERPVALVQLKNRSGLVKKTSSIKISQETRRLLFVELIKRGYFLIVKPHPGEISQQLIDGLKTISVNDYRISELPVSYLSSISHCSVLEMPSNSVMDAIASDKRTYWPYEIFIKNQDTLNRQQLIKQMIKIGFPASFFDLVELGFPVVTEARPVNKRIKDKFEQLANSHIELGAVIETCESLVLSSNNS